MRAAASFFLIAVDVTCYIKAIIIIFTSPFGSKADKASTFQEKSEREREEMAVE